MEKLRVCCVHKDSAVCVSCVSHLLQVVLNKNWDLLAQCLHIAGKIVCGRERGEGGREGGRRKVMDKLEERRTGGRIQRKL